ncbi:MAG: hypothetical protein VX291_05470, partial [Gemmatimonadota bacterium]|nr:hypothetical protein [Gemmatimonadota bacterium]
TAWHPPSSSTVGHVAHVTAYLDGGTISLVVAAVAGAVAGIGVYAQSLLQRIKRFVRRISFRPDCAD